MEGSVSQNFDIGPSDVAIYGGKMYQKLPVF